MRRFITFLLLAFCTSGFLLAQNEVVRGVQITLLPDVENISDIERESLLPVLSARLEAAGIDAYSLRITGSGEITIALPNVETSTLTEAFLDLLLQPGFVEFVDLSGVAPGNVRVLEGTTIVTDAQVARNPELSDIDPVYLTVLSGENLRSVAVQSESGAGGVVSILDILTGEAVPEDSGRWFVAVEFDDDGADAMAAYTSTYIGMPLGIVLDGVLLSAPIVQSTLSDSAIITGNFSAKDAAILAEQLRSGALSVPLRLESIETYMERYMLPEANED